jgi:hypothetical protein
VAGGAGVGDAGLFREHWGDETERVGCDVIVFNRLLDTRHVTGRTLTTGTPGSVMSVLGDGTFEACYVLSCVALQADLIAAGVEVGGVLVVVDLVAVEAADLAMVHITLHEIVALHAVFVRGKVGELEKVCCAGFKFFELPVVGEVFAYFEADGPVVVLSLDGIGEGLALAMTLDAGVVGTNKVESAGVDDVRLGRMGGVKTAGTVAFLTTNVPLGDLVGVDVVIHGVAAVAERASGTLLVGLAVERNPPVSSLLDVKWKPALFIDVPLGRLDEVVIPDFCEVALLVAAAVDKSDLLEIEGDERISMGEVAENGFGINGRIAHDVGHASLLPTRVLGRVAALAGLRTYVVRRSLTESRMKSEHHYQYDQRRS